MDDNDWQKIIDRAVDISTVYLSDLKHYPIIDGRIAFFDEDIYEEYRKVGRSRSSEHMSDADMWDLTITQSEKSIRAHITNRKEVYGSRKWNLLDDILDKGTSMYTIKRKKMTYYNRYKSHWCFKQTSRPGIRPIFSTKIKELVKTAILEGLTDAMIEYRDGRL
jgi:hypothetical protein